MSGDARAALYSSIKKSRVPSQENEFIPETSLRRLITAQAVRDILGEPGTNDVTDFFTTKAFKVFAILASIPADRELFLHIHKHRFQDDMLPIQRIWNTHVGSSWKIHPYAAVQDKKDINAIFYEGNDSPWGDDDYKLRTFHDALQWPFISPVFVDNKFRYKFPGNTRLPFTNSNEKKRAGSNSSFSYVQEMSIHVDHIPKHPDLIVDEQNNPRVAIKELVRMPQSSALAQGEADVLETIRKSHDEHLIKAIAYFQKGDDHYFMFPWAELGNLREFLKTVRPNTDKTYIKWVLTEIAGLAGAIGKLHSNMVQPSESLGANIRHGDMKPENILCFKRETSSKNMPRLVITDVGLAKAHNEATKFRSKTTSKAATERYEAPELGIDPDAPRSRRFDIWSLGCIYLEVVIWLLYGREKLQEFVGMDGPFYDTTNQRRFPWLNRSDKHAKVHPLVKMWVSYIRKDWRCADKTAIRRLVELIATRMLVIKLNSHKDGNDSTISTKGQSEACSTLSASESETPKEERGSAAAETEGSATERNRSSAMKIGVPRRQASNPPTSPNIRKASTWLGIQSRTDRLQVRAYADEIHKELTTILGDLAENQIKSIGDRPQGNPPIPEGLKLSTKGSTSESKNTTYNVGG